MNHCLVPRKNAKLYKACKVPKHTVFRIVFKSHYFEIVVTDRICSCISKVSLETALTTTGPNDTVTTLPYTGDGSTDVKPIDVDDTGLVPTQSSILSLRYFHDGWYGLAPNWETDLQIVLNRDRTFHVSSKHRDQECGKQPRVLTDNESIEFKKLLAQMQTI